jgi:hypothetical protein
MIHPIQYIMRCCNLIEDRMLFIYLQNFPKDLLRVYRASILYWYSNADIVRLRENPDNMLLAVLLNCFLVGMELILVCSSM